MHNRKRNKPVRIGSVFKYHIQNQMKHDTWSVVAPERGGGNSGDPPQKQSIVPQKLLKVKKVF